ncbi:hypothetical protein LCGC14_3044780 [marine sediment metagenome]|uniref:Uncharacterized protein n=1 Tax=marine sediment metagenome TaxID=412755 RepID=A0A0F8YWJ3_9ZZZZ
MSTVVRRTTLTPIYNVETSKYDILYFFFDPDLSAVANVPERYWQESGGVFSEMDQTGKDAVDAAILAANTDRDRRVAKRRIAKRDLIAFAEIVMNEINILRIEHGLNVRTLPQLVAAIENKIDEN